MSFILFFYRGDDFILVGMVGWRQTSDIVIWPDLFKTEKHKSWTISDKMIINGSNGLDWE